LILPTAIFWMCQNNGMGCDNESNGGMNLMLKFLRREPLM
jgi:hypothetical protein